MSRQLYWDKRTTSLSRNQRHLHGRVKTLHFTAPASGTVILKITSNAAAGCGNEFALDDISFHSLWTYHLSPDL